MASRQSTVAFAYPRRGGTVRSATHIDRHSLALIIGLLALAAFAGVLYLSQASVAAELRFLLVDREREAQEIWEQNLTLRRDIADRDRMASIEERVARLGMVTAPPTEPHLVCAVPPFEPAALASTSGPASREQSEPAGLWEEMMRRLGLARRAGPAHRIVLNAAHP